MENSLEDTSVKTLAMDTEEHYREQANTYRSSAAYSQMKRLYPLLQTYIESCSNEQLIA